MADSHDRQRRPQLDRDPLLALWQDGVPLGHAWEVFADEWSATRFRELQRTDSHLGFQRSLQIGFVARLYAGERQAIGIEGGSDVGPILIPQYYFSKTAEVDWGKGTVAALGKIFHEVRVQWQREPPDVTRPRQPARWIHPRELEEGQWELGPSSEPEPFPGEQWEWEPLDETSPSGPESPNEQLTQAELESTEETPLSESTSTKFGETPSPGRPSKKPEVERAIQILLERGVPLASMPRTKAYKAVRACAAKELNSNVEIGFTDPVIHRALFERFGRRR
jgi:hypothetical protein